MTMLASLEEWKGLEFNAKFNSSFDTGNYQCFFGYKLYRHRSYLLRSWV